jgi:hypothetical protein
VGWHRSSDWASSGQISRGEVLQLVGKTAADVVLSRIDGRNAGYLVDDYYSYQYPRYYDGRYSDYNAYLNDPYYFDPYRRTSSYQYVNSYIPGLYDLDYYGDWRNLKWLRQCLGTARRQQLGSLSRWLLDDRLSVRSNMGLE